MLTRRQMIQTAAASASAAALLPQAALAQDQPPEGANHDTADGAFGIVALGHASLLLTTPGGTILVDPVVAPDVLARQPAPDLILITHEHGDHFDVPTLEALAGGTAPLITNQAVYDKLPEALKSRATAMANGEAAGILEGKGVIEAIPAYNTTADRAQYHPKGRDNGYVLGFGGTRIYIAGDTEDIPEMRALKDITIAFLPMNLPYTMDVDQAASATNEFKPAHVYPYHYRGQDPQKFADLVTDSQVSLLRWYPE